MFFKDVSIDRVHLSDDHQRIFGILIAIGFLLQLLLGQRLALVYESSMPSTQRLLASAGDPPVLPGWQ